MEADHHLSDLKDQSEDLSLPESMNHSHSNNQLKEHKMPRNSTEEDLVLTTQDDPMDKCPPDFSFAKKHREANRVKNLDMRNMLNKDMNDERMYCP